MVPGYDDTPRSADQGATATEQGSPVNAAHDTSGTSTETTPWSADYAEVCLLRGLLYSRYADVLRLCDGRPVEALQGEPRRVILRTLLQTAHDAVAAGAGDQHVTPAAVLARLQNTPGREALDAVRVYLPEALAGEVRGAYATTPAVEDVSLLWDSVERARLVRAVEIHGRALVAAAIGGDLSILAVEVQRGEFLQQLAARVGVTPGAYETQDQDAGHGSTTDDTTTVRRAAA